MPPEIKNKVITSPFVDWKELPKLIRSIDINLAPLEDTVFNEAKSENKWTEAALVKIPTVASNVGAFKSQIKNNETGILCNNLKEWKQGLEKIITDANFRNSISEKAYNEVMNKHITTKSGYGVAEFIKSKLRKNICFVLPSTNVSGGIMVAMKHGLILKKNGYDVTMININKETRKIDKLSENNEYLFVVPIYRTEYLAYIDTMVATMWITLKYVRKYFNCKNRKYLVQGMETEFYAPGDFEKKLANSTYCNIFDVEYLTISKWCKKWLLEEFHTKSKYVSNGLDLNLFPYKKRKFDKKIKILVEGNCNDQYKNVDESFLITNKLDKSKYEIHYMSYEKEPKKWYRIDKFYHKIPHEKVGTIYENCDILIKTSILESFSYPPLEMMATGGYVVALQNDGNSEYLKDNYNSLIYEKGNIDDAINKIKMLSSNVELRDKLEKNGLNTAKKYAWDNLEQDILSLYE